MFKIFLILSFLISFFAHAQQWKTFTPIVHGEPENSITFVEVDKNNVVWATARNNLLKFNGTDWQVFDTSNSPFGYANINQINIDSSNNKWVCTLNRGLIKVSTSEQFEVFNTTNSPLPSNAVTSVAFEGNAMWIGTGNGLVKKVGTTWTIYNTSNSGLPINQVWYIAIENYVKWIGTYGGGLAKFNDTVWAVYNHFNSPLPWDQVMDIKIDKNNNKWILPYVGGVVKFNSLQNQWAIYNPDNSPFPLYNISIDVDSSNNKWIGTDGKGIIKFTEPSTWLEYNRVNSPPLGTDNINSLTFDKYQNMWIGAGIVYEFNPNGIVGVTPIVIPHNYNLDLSVYPNPFNPLTNIEININKKSDIEIRVFDVLGKNIKTLRLGTLTPNSYKIKLDMQEFNSGIYFLTLNASELLLAAKKIILLK